MLGFGLRLAYDTGIIVTIGLGFGLRIGWVRDRVGVGLKCNYFNRGVHT